jgi:glycosyltransferase involved in cell wall biosynthesis
MIAYTNYAIDARVRREAETLAAAGFRVLCLTTRNGTKASQFLQEGVEVRELSVPKYRGKSTLAYLASYLRFLLSSCAVCVRLLLRNELDIVHVHNLPDFLVLAGLIPRLAGRKVVLDVHDSLPETFASKFSSNAIVWRALCLEEQLSAFLAHKVICVNQPQQEALVARGIARSKTFVSLNVPDPRIFRRCPSGLDTWAEGDAFDLVYHGTMAKRLGVDLIIRAVERLQDDIPGLRLHLWGQGDDLPDFRTLVKELGVEQKVFFKPEGFPLQELPHHLRAKQVGVVGNRRDVATGLMLPVKLMEYVSLGIPVVVPRLKTIEHYFSDDMVAYYVPEDIASLADAICGLYRDPDGRRRQADMGARFLDDYGWERRGPELVTFHRRLMEN